MVTFGERKDVIVQTLLARFELMLTLWTIICLKGLQNGRYVCRVASLVMEYTEVEVVCIEKDTASPEFILEDPCGMTLIHQPNHHRPLMFLTLACIQCSFFYTGFFMWRFKKKT